MTTSDIIVAVLIALYSMIGGALLNAAITAPKNCYHVIDHLGRPVFKALFWTGMAASVLYPLAGYLSLVPADAGVFNLPGIWIGLANLSLAILLRGCRTVAVSILTKEQPPPSRRAP